MLNIPQRSRDYWLLWFVALSALALNVWLLNTLLGVRRQAGEAAAVAAQEIKLLRESSFEYTVRIDQSLPISLTVPFKQTFNIPIHQIVPISTSVPIKLNVPIRLTIADMPIDSTLDRAETYLEDLGGQFGVRAATPTP